MNDLTAIRNFRAERDAEPPAARKAIWRALEARMDAAATEARSFGEAVAESQPPAGRRNRRGGGRRAHLTRRRLLAFAAALVAAGVVAGVLVLGSGPTAQRASAAEILREAAAAASSGRPTSVPGPGQYYFRAEERLEVEGWISPVPGLSADTGTASIGAPMKYKNAYNAVVPTRVEWWTGPEGNGRYREELGDLQFWSGTEEHRWKRAGSPLPPPFNPEFRKRYPISYRDALEANSHVVDTKNKGYGDTFHFPDTSKLPTDPKALRRAVEANAIEVGGFNLLQPKAKRLTAEETKEQLINVLFEGEPTPQLQAAIFNALAEVPGIKVTATTDSLGREGDAITYSPRAGVRSEFLFDPRTSDLLATRSVLVRPAASVSLKEVPAGTIVNERDFLQRGVVDSIRERPGSAEARGSAGATG